MIALEWCAVPAGPFTMGSEPAGEHAPDPDEAPAHRVHCPRFRIGRTPVTNAASSDARYSAALATSQAEPWCPSGTREARADASSARSRPVARAGASTAIGVSMSPGMIALARMLKRALLDAIDCVSAFTPALEIL